MRYGIFTLMVLVVGAIGYAAATSQPSSTQPSNGGSCCGMNMMGMHSGMGCSMGGMTPTTQPAAATPDENAACHQ